ncbi:unnamed protein product, partial [Strongylus vulgaris]
MSQTCCEASNRLGTIGTIYNVRYRPEGDQEEDWFAENKQDETLEEMVFVEIRAENEERIKLACLAIRGLVADSREPKVTKHLNVEPHAMEAIL